MEREFLTPEEVAEYLGVSVDTARRMSARREIASYKIGGRIRFKVEDVRAYADGQRKEALPQYIDMGA